MHSLRPLYPQCYSYPLKGSCVFDSETIYSLCPLKYAMSSVIHYCILCMCQHQCEACTLMASATSSSVSKKHPLLARGRCWPPDAREAQFLRVAPFFAPPAPPAARPGPPDRRPDRRQFGRPSPPTNLLPRVKSPEAGPAAAAHITVRASDSGPQFGPP